MRIVFFGTPDFAVPSLKALLQHHDVALVVTREDAVRSRGKVLEPSPVALAAQEAGIDVVKASRVDEELIARVRDLGCELGVVVAYGRLLPDALLESVERGFINVHGSLLPRWRGAAPIQRAILAGDEELGVSIMRVVHEMDAGAYCLSASVPAQDKNATQLSEELSQLGARILLESIDSIQDGSVQWTEQDESLVCYADKISKQEMMLDSADSAKDNLARIRASLDTAPARCAVGGKGLRVTDARLYECFVPSAEHAAGDVLPCDGGVCLVAADGAVQVLGVKPDGKREMTGDEWAKGLHFEGLRWSRL